MDQTDRQIVEMLRSDGRRSNVEIARELGISEGTVRKRIDRLLSSDILKIVGVVDPTLAGYGTRSVIFLNVELARAEQAASLLADMPEVLSVCWVTGEYDLIVEAVFEADQHLMSFLNDRVSRIPGVLSSKTAHVLRIEKRHAEWALPRPPLPRVLVVDDDPDFLESTRMVLEQEGYEVDTASSGEQALKAMVASTPSLVVLDVMMEGILDGWDASWRIRSHPELHHLPILVVSSITTSDYLNMFPTDEDNLIDNFLSKPVAPETLLAEIGRLLSRA